MVALLGHRDELLKLVEAAFADAEILVRGNEITISGSDADRVGRLFDELVLLLTKGQPLDAADVGRTIDMVKADESPSAVMAAEVLRSSRGRTVRPKTSGQRQYVEAISRNVVTFGIGPAGTGKSYLAVALAVQALHARTVNRIILTRPAARSTWVTSPVTTALEPKPMRVRNIFICSGVVFWASSRMRKLSFRVRPRMKARGATSMVSPSSRRLAPSGPSMSYRAS